MIVNLCVPFAGILCSLKFCISATRNFSRFSRNVGKWAPFAAALCVGGVGVLVVVAKFMLQLQLHRVAVAPAKLNQSVCVASREQTGHRDWATLMTRPRPRAINGGRCLCLCARCVSVCACVCLVPALLLPWCVNSFTSMSQTASYKQVRWSCKLGLPPRFLLELGEYY